MRTLPLAILIALTSAFVARTQAKLDMLTHFSARVAEGDVVDVSKVTNSVRISLSQRAVIAFNQRGDRLLRPRRAQEARKGPVVTLDFSRHDTERGVVMLQIESIYPRIVRYRIAIRAKGELEFRETTALPLNPNVPVLEGWKGPFEELILFDFHLTDEKPPKTA